MSGNPNPAARFPGVERVVELPPDPRIAEALGLQHSIETALADIIDNSIEAGASSVWVRFITDDEYLERILVVDNGDGMTSEKLEASLQLGARREYSPGSLGMYGIGLKASAFSLADALTVTTMTEGGIAAAMTTPRMQDDAFRSFVHSPADADARIMATEVPFEIQHGTIVDLRGIRGHSVDDDRSVRRAWLDDRIRRLRNHFGLVFHRFIDSERVRLTIDVYDARLRDAGPPFHPVGIDPLRPATGKLGYPRTMTVDLPDGLTTSIQTHVIAPGARNGDVLIHGESRTDWQGVFAYRNNRLLRLGGWDEITSKKTDLQLARVLIEISEADIQWFGMNAEKNGVAFSPELARAIQSAGDDDVSFKDFLQDARDVLRQSNRRTAALKPIAAMGSGMPADVEDVAGQVFGFREHEMSVNVRWQKFPPGRIFNIDLPRATIWLNEHHRETLGRTGAEEAGLIKTLLFLLFEDLFSKSTIQQITRDRISAIEMMIGAALGIAVSPQAGTTITDQTLELTDAADETSDTDSIEENPLLTEALRLVPDDDEPGPVVAPPPVEEWLPDSFRQYMDVVGRHPLLRADEEVALAKRIEAGVIAADALANLPESDRRSAFARELQWVARDGTRAMERMTAGNLRLVISIAKRHRNRGLEILDLIQEGNEGLLRAIEKFDYKLGYKFSTYATWWIRQGIARALADQGASIRLPVHMAEFGTKVRRARKTLEQALDRRPTTQEIAADIDEDVAKVALYLRMSKPVLSLNAPVDLIPEGDVEDLEVDEFGAPDGTEVEFGEVIEDEIDAVEEALAQSLLIGQIEAVLAQLDDRAAEIIRLRFGLIDGVPLTLDQIGARFKVTRERIRQIETKALKRLREPEIMDILGLAPRADTIGTPPPSADSRRRRAPRTDTRHAPIEHTRLAEGASSQTGVATKPLVDPEDALAALNEYRHTGHVRAVASTLGFDDRETALALTRLLLWQSGSIDDSMAASRHGASWASDEVDRVVQCHISGMPLNVISDLVGRTQLAVAWRLLDNTARPVKIPDELSDAATVAERWNRTEPLSVQHQVH